MKKTEEVESFCKADSFKMFVREGSGLLVTFVRRVEQFSAARKKEDVRTNLLKYGEIGCYRGEDDANIRINLGDRTVQIPKADVRTCQKLESEDLHSPVREFFELMSGLPQRDEMADEDAIFFLNQARRIIDKYPLLMPRDRFLE